MQCTFVQLEATVRSIVVNVSWKVQLVCCAADFPSTCSLKGI